MKRDCILYKSSSIYNRHIYLDFEKSDEILDFIEKYKKKFEYIVGRILEQNFMYYDDYCPVELDDQCKGLTEMRFFPNGDNARLYCKEVDGPNGKVCIIAIKVLPKKKSMKIDNTIKNSLKAIAKYEYEIE